MLEGRVEDGGREGNGGHGGRGVRMRWGGDLGCEGESEAGEGKGLARVGWQSKWKGSPRRRPYPLPARPARWSGVAEVPGRSNSGRWETTGEE